MQSNVKKMMAKFFADRKNRRRLAAIVTSLSVLVVAGVFWQLMQPAVTLTPDPICGQEAHIHDAGCYEQLLTCTLAEDESHTHGEGCYQSILTCGKQEHVHTDACYPEKVTEPTQAPAAAEQHEPAAQADAEPTPAAAPDAENAALPAEEPAENQTNAGEGEAQPAAEPAENEDNATEPADGEQPAAEPAENKDNGTEPADGEQPAADETDKPDEVSKPDTEVPEEQEGEPGEQPAEEEKPAEENPVETDPAEEPAAPLTLSALSASAAQVTVGQTVTWSFAAEQADKILYAVTDESGAILTQGDAAGDCRQVTWQATHAGRITLTVSAQRGEEAASASGSIEVLAAQELTAYVSAGVRYGVAGGSVAFTLGSDGGAAPVTLHAIATQDGTVVAETDVESGTWTVATLSASRATSLEVTLRATDAVGTVTEASCTLPLSTDKAETRDQWVASAAISKSGQWPKDVAAVARTQLGYAESEDNFIIDDNGVTHGWTRYGAWYGASYSEWCAMYASFCLHYAGVPESAFPQEASCSRWISALRGRGLYADAAEATPGVGDLIFLDWEQDGAVDHVGIITAVSGSGVTTIEGNVNHAVAERSYGLTDGRIVGYGLLNAAWAAQEEANQPADEGQPAEEQPAAGEDPATDTTLDKDPATDTTLEEKPATDTTLGDSVASDTTLNGDVDDDEWSMTGDDVQSASDLLTDSANIIVDEEVQETITVTFKITNPDYTNDPGSNRTHITVKEPIDGASELTFEKWTSKKYKVFGTGTVTTVTIPKGTSIAANGLSLPDLDITNIADGNQNTYISVYSWMNGGTVCTDTTVFTEDTELELQLYTNDNNWSLDFVCCETMNSIQVTNKSVTFKEGDCISAAYIPTAEQMNALTFSEIHAHKDQVFDHWYVLDQEGNQVVFTETTRLTNDYEYANSSGRHIKIYAAWRDKDATVDVSFMVDDVLHATKVIEANTALMELPAAPDKDGYVFMGWRTDGVNAFATAETKVEQDTVFQAVYGHKVVFVQEDGTEVSYTVEHGQPLSSVMASLPVAAEGKYWRTSLEDETPISASLDFLVEQDTTFTMVAVSTVAVTFVAPNYDTVGDDGTVTESVVVATYTIIAGESLQMQIAEENRPTAPAYVGHMFDGWYTSASDGTATKLDWNGNVELYADTTYTAVYKKIEQCTVRLHDMGPDGNEILPEQVASIDVTVPYGATLGEYLDVTLADGTAAADCVWNTLDADSKKVAYALSTPVICDLDLYTYSYRLVLQLGSADAGKTGMLRWLIPSAEAATVTLNADGNEIIIEAREGETLKASDFVIDGVDYTLYTWTKDGTAYTLANLIGKTITENVVLSGTEQETVTISMHYYALVNENENGELIKNEVSTKVHREYVNTQYRYYVSAATLESVYGAFGFNATDLTSNTQNYFGHRATKYTADPTLWNDGNLIEVNGVWFVPVINSTADECDVFYLPGADRHTGSGVAVKTYSEAKRYTFYTVEVSDPLGLAYANPNDIPDVQYVLYNEEASVTVPAKDISGNEITWKNGSSSLPAGTYNNDKTTVTYTFKNISDAVSLIPADETHYVVTYNINLPSGVTIQTETPTINGGATYSAPVSKSDETYELLYPTQTEFGYSANSGLVSYQFLGWSKNQNSTAAEYAAGTGYPLTGLIGDNDTVELYAVWANQTKQYSVSFYLNLESIAFTYNDDGPQGGTIEGNKGWTDPLYSAGVTINPAPTSSSWPSGKYPADGTQTTNNSVVIYDRYNETGSNVNANITTDTVIRTQLCSSDGVQAKYDGAERTFKISSMPSNETVLAAAREKQKGYISAYTDSSYTSPTQYVKASAENKLIYNATTDQVVPAEEINSDNYYIVWYVFKYDDGNGWHIDGTLKPKQAKLRVTKTFYGDANMITAAKANFNVTVSGTNYEKTLHLNDNNVTQNGNTYTWMLDDVAQKVTYTVEEHSYYTTDNEKTTSAEYRVVNPAAGTTVTPGWHVYNNGVQVVAIAYADTDTNIQTVQLLNSYVPEKTLMIRKVDNQGNALEGVSFQMTKNGQLVTLYRKAGDSYYYLNSPEEATETNTMTTDADGVIWLKWADSTETATYNGEYLVEEVNTPEGYNKVDPFTIKIDGNDVTLTTANRDDVDLTNGHLTVVNKPKTASVTVKKVWVNQDEARPVTLTLYQNGVSTGKTVTLNGTIDDEGENSVWGCTWTDLDLFTAGQVIRYTVREDSIGDVHYDASADADGYADWTVTRLTTYYDAAGNAITSNYANAARAEVVVTNSIAKNDVNFTKQNGETQAALPGAVFTLYRNEACTNPVNTATSGDSGLVSFNNLNPGTYYMKETSTPAGYQDNATVYKVNVQGNGFTITAVGGDETALTVIKNTPVHNADVKLVKQDGHGNALNGAAFQLKRKNEQGTYVAEGEAVTLSNTHIFTDLAPGDYQLVETKAPDGYYKLTQPINFTVNLDGTVECNSQANAWSFEASTKTITVTNTAGSQLPQTGGSGTLVYMFGGLLMMAASLICGLSRRRKGERGEGR